MNTARIFTTGRSQAVRLPKQYRFKTDDVCIVRINDVVILYPPGKGWNLLERGIRHFAADFMTDRGQPSQAEDRAQL